MGYSPLKIIWDHIVFTLKQMAKDTKSLIILLLMPFILIVVLGAALSNTFNGDEYQFEAAKIGIIDLDQTLASRLLIEKGFKNNEIMKLIQIEEYSDQEQAEQRFKAQKLDGVLYIHQGYEYNFIFGIKDEILLKMNPTKSIQTDIVKEVLNQYHVLGKMVVDSVNGGRSIQNFPSIQSFLSNQSILLEVKAGNEEEKQINSYQYYAIGMGVMYTLFTILTGVGLILGEQKQHTLDRIRMMPFPTSLFYLGKTLAFIIISILQMIILFVSSHFVFGINFGDQPLYIFAIILLYSFATGGLMILLMSFISNPDSLNSLFSIGVPVIAALGGSMVPISLFPWFIEPISNLLPNRHAMEAMFQIILGRPNLAIPSIFYLSFFAIITSLIGIWQMNRRGERLS